MGSTEEEAGEEDEEKLRHVEGYLSADEVFEESPLPRMWGEYGWFGTVRSRVTVGWELQVEIEVFGK